MNPAYAALHGLEANDLIGHELGEFLGEDVFHEIVKPKLDQCFMGEDVRYKDIFHFPGLDSIHMDIRYLPLVSSNGSIDRAVIMIRDITTIRHPVPSPCRDKIMRLLESARQVNHDINNPLFATTGYLELLLQIENDPRKTEFLDSALKNAQKVAEVAKRLTDVINNTEFQLPGEPGESSVV